MAIEGNRISTYVAPAPCVSAADAIAAADAVRARRKALFYVSEAPRITLPVQPAKIEKPIYVPSLAEKFAAALRDSPILKATSVNGSIIAPDAVMASAYTIDSFQRAMCLVSDIRKIEMLGGRRLKHIVEPRQIAMFLCKRFTGRSLPEIGRRFGGKDHTTVLHAIRKYEWMAEMLPADGSRITEIAEKAWALYRERSGETTAA